MVVAKFNELGTLFLLTLALSLVALLFVQQTVLASLGPSFSAKVDVGGCRSVAAAIPQPYAVGYQRRDQVIDVDGLRYAAHKWSGPIERKDFNAAGETSSARVHFKIIDSTLYAKASNTERLTERPERRYFKVLEPILMAIHLYRIPDMEFWVELEDILECNRPAFTFSLNTECERGGFAIPSYGAYTAALGEAQLKHLFECLDKQHPYSDRIPKGVWRGSTTGLVPTMEDYMQNRRLRLAHLARNWTDIMDVGLYRYINAKDDVKAILQQVAPLVPRIEMEDYNDFALVLDLDGNGWSDCLSTLVTYNTPVVKQATNLQEYFGHLLQAGVHIETFDETLTDVVPRLQELLREYKASPKRLHAMVETMHKFALTHSSHLGCIRAVAYGLTVYASKLTWKTEMETGFVEVKKTGCCERNKSFPAKFLEAVRAG